MYNLSRINHKKYFNTNVIHKNIFVAYNVCNFRQKHKFTNYLDKSRIENKHRFI